MENPVYNSALERKIRNSAYIKDRSTPIEQAMLYATFDLHRAIEDTPFAQTMVTKTIKRSAYAKYVSQVYFIYKAIEELNEKCQHNPVFGQIYFPDEMCREKKIEEDLEYLFGDNWRKCISILPSTEKYVKRMNYIAETKPELMVAHNFVRYFGEMSGGQVLKYKVRKCCQLPDDLKGVKFYEFDNVKDLNKFKQFYLSRLNAMELQSDIYDEMLDEARIAFELNMDVFDELHSLTNSVGYYDKLLTGFRQVCQENVWKATTAFLGVIVMSNLFRSRNN